MLRRSGPSELRPALLNASGGLAESSQDNCQLVPYSFYARLLTLPSSAPPPRLNLRQVPLSTQHGPIQCTIIDRIESMATDVYPANISRLLSHLAGDQETRAT